MGKGGHNLALAIAASILLHVILALVLGVYFAFAPEPDVLATLDLSSVELSFADQVDEAAAAVPSAEATPQNPFPKPEVATEAPAVSEELKPTPPDPSAPKFLEPKESVRFVPKDAVKDDLPSANQTIRQSEQSNNSQPAPRQARVDAPPRPKRTIRPDYPKGSRQRGEQGDVVLEIRVSERGVVEAVSVVTSSGFAELDAAAVRAAKAAKFSPARSGRETVASTARLKLQFKLK